MAIDETRNSKQRSWSVVCRTWEGRIVEKAKPGKDISECRKKRKMVGRPLRLNVDDALDFELCPYIDQGLLHTQRKKALSHPSVQCWDWLENKTECPYLMAAAQCTSMSFPTLICGTFLNRHPTSNMPAKHNHSWQTRNKKLYMSKPRSVRNLLWSPLELTRHTVAKLSASVHNANVPQKNITRRIGLVCSIPIVLFASQYSCGEKQCDCRQAIHSGSNGTLAAVGKLSIGINSPWS